MARFERVVTEVRSVTCLYVIEADSDSEADDKALAGDTVSETDLRDNGVIDRNMDAS